MNGKICVVTGANAGLGFETAKALALKNAELIMLCRSAEKGQAAKAQIEEASGNKHIHVLQTNLASQASVRETADRINKQWGKVDVLVNNAATVSSRHTLTEDGVETVFAVNHLAYFLLTHCLLGSLLESTEARVVNLSSGNHAKAQLNLGDLNLENSYHVMRAYNQSKLANVLFTYEMDRQLKARNIRNMAVNCINPGLNDTAIGEKSTNFFHALAWRIRRSMGMHPSEGAKCQIYVASAPELNGVSGKFWLQSQVIPSSKLSYDQELAASLWQRSLELCRITDYFSAK